MSKTERNETREERAAGQNAQEEWMERKERLL